MRHKQRTRNEKKKKAKQECLWLHGVLCENLSLAPKTNSLVSVPPVLYASQQLAVAIARTYSTQSESNNVQPEYIWAEIGRKKWPRVLQCVCDYFSHYRLGGSCIHKSCDWNEFNGTFMSTLNVFTNKMNQHEFAMNLLHDSNTLQLALSPSLQVWVCVRVSNPILTIRTST